MFVLLIVIDPRPKDIESFERVYLYEPVPMAVEKPAGKTKISWLAAGNAAVPSRCRDPFPTMKALEGCAASEGGKQTIANEVAISSGGEPCFSKPPRLTA